ncbi:MAG: hypothetical protein EBZ48_05855 [Proteobacteria bacterium]|nr:hypothetical protein [Pseudomonadota bacterium]
MVLQPEKTPEGNPLVGVHLPAVPLEEIAIPNTNGKMRGLLALPPCYEEDKQHPGLLVIGGSEGGIYRRAVLDWAREGYVTLGVAYHKGKTGEQSGWKDLQDWGNVPEDLVNIDINGFIAAARHLKDIGCSRIGLQGTSRGGELALMLASTFPDTFNAVCAVTPSKLVKLGYSHNDEKFGEISSQRTPAWNLGQQPIIHSSPIQVEKITCPVIAISGGKDEIWARCHEPGDDFNAANILAPLINNNRKDCMALHYPEAGHFFSHNAEIEGILSLVTDKERWKADSVKQGGGTDFETTQQAGEAAYQETREFFRKWLLEPEQGN